jgi:type II secretion system protein D
MKLRMTYRGSISLFLGLILSFPLTAAFAQQPPATQPARPPDSQEALEKLMRLRDEMQKQQEEREKAGQAGDKTKPPTSAPTPPARTTSPPSVRQPATGRTPATPLPPSTPPARGRMSLEEMRNRARTSTQRTTPPGRGARQPSVPPDFVGPPEALANNPPPEEAAEEPKEVVETPSEEETPPAVERKPRHKPGPDEAEDWFAFEDTPWEDVIKVFVDRIGKPLLMEEGTIPTGTLTYTSDRKFTKQEAIDELNLIMNEKRIRFVEEEHHIRIVPTNEMKQYIPLKDTYNSVDVFQQANPRDMEFVTVYYQVTDRPAKVYVDAFTDALPEPTLILALPDSNQIKIIGLARDVRRFLTLKDRIDLTPEDPRVMKFFNIKTNAADIEQRVRAFLRIGGGGGTMPQMQLVRDPATGRMIPQQVAPPGGGGEGDVLMVADERTNSIIVKATQDKVEEIGDLIQRLDEKPDIGEFKTKVIEVQHADASEVANLLNQILQQEQGQAQARMPQWQLQRQIQQQLMQQQQQQRLNRRGQPIQPQPQPMQPMQMGMAPEDIVVEGIFERAKKTIRLVADARTNSLIVYANEEGFQRVQDMLKIIDQPLPDNFQTFVLQYARVADVAPVITQIVGGLTPAGGGGRAAPSIVPDEAKNTLYVIAERDMMDKIAELVDQFDVAGPAQQRHVIELKNLRPSAVAQMVQTLLAGGGGTAATPNLPRMPRGRGGPGGPLAGGGAPTRAENYQIIPLDEAQTLIVVCSDEDWAKVEQTIQMWDEHATTSTPRLQMFPIAKGNAQSIANTLTTLYRQYEHPVLGRTSVAIQPDADKVWVYAVQPALDEIGALIKTLDVENVSDKVEILPVVNADVTQLQQQLQALFVNRGVRGGAAAPLIQAEPVTNSLIVQAEKSDMDKIKDFALKMDQKIGAQATEQRFFELRYRPAAEVATTVQNIFGGTTGGGRGAGGRAQVRAMPAGAQVLVEAPKEKFAAIEAFIKQYDDPKGKEIVVKTIKVPGNDVTQVAQTLTQIVNSMQRPDGLRGTFIPDVATESIIASAPADMYPKIDELVTQYTTGSEDLAIERRFYPITIADAGYIADLLQKQLTEQVKLKKGQTVASRISISVDPRQNQVIINAPKLVHPLADELIKVLDRADTTEVEPVTVDLKHADANQVAQTINAIFGAQRGAQGQSRQQDVQALVGNGVLVIKAPKSKLDDVQKLIGELDAVDTRIQVKTYTLKVLNATQVALQIQTYLRSISPPQRGGQLQPGAFAEPTTNSLVVLAPAEQLPFVDSLVTQFESAERPEAGAQAYALKNARAEQVAPNIDTMLKAKVAEREGDVRKSRIQTAVVADQAGNRLFVFAPPDYQKLAAELIRMVDEEVTVGDIVHIIPLENGDAAQVALAVQQVIAANARGSGTPGARSGTSTVRVSADAGSNSILLGGMAKDIADVEKWVKDLESNSVRVPELQVFQVKNVTTKKIEDAIKGMFGGAKNPVDAVTVTSDEYNGQLIVTANKRKMRQVETCIQELDRPPTEGETGLGPRQVYFVNIYRGKAFDIAWSVRDLLPPEKEGGPSIETDYFDEYLIVKCRPSEFPNIEKLIRQFDSRAKLEMKVVTIKLRGGDPDRVLQYLQATGEMDNVVIERAAAAQKPQTLIEDLWKDGEEPDAVRDKRERNGGDKPGRQGRALQPFQSALPLSQLLLDDIEKDLAGPTLQPAVPPRPAARSGARVSQPGVSIISPAIFTETLLADQEPPTRGAPAAPPAARSERSETTQPVPQREKTRVIYQPDGTVLIQGPKDAVDDLDKAIALLEEDLTVGEVVRIFHFKYGDVSAAAEILSMMFDVQQRQIVIPQPQPQPQQQRGGQQRPGDEGREPQGGLFDQLRGVVGGKPAGTGKTGATPMRIATDPGHNYLIVKCQESLLPDIRQLLRELDIPPGEVQIQIFQLKNLLADETAENIKDVLGISKAQQRRGGGRTPTPPTPGRGPQQQLLEMLQQQLVSVPGVEGGAKVERVEIVPNSITNSLLVSAPPEVMELIKGVIGDLEKLEGRDMVGIHYYELKHARAADLQPLLQEIFASAAGEGGGGGARPRGPGGRTANVSGGASPAALGPVTISSDPRRPHTLIYTAQSKDVPTIEEHVKALDLEGSLADAEMYLCEWGDASTIVPVLEALFGGGSGAAGGGQRGQRSGAPTGAAGTDLRIVAEPTTNAILVWGPPDKRDLVFQQAEALDQMGKRDIREIPVAKVPPSQIVGFISLFMSENAPAAGPQGRGRGAAEEAAPQIVPNDNAKTLVVRGSQRQINQIEELVQRFDNEDIVQQQIKIIEIPYGQDVQRLAGEVERVVNQNEDELASRSGRQPRRVIIGADDFTHSIFAGGDPAMFGQVEAIVKQLGEIRSPQAVTRVIELKNVSAQDAEDLINTLQRKSGSTSGGRAPAGGGGGGGGIRRPSGGGTPPAARPPSAVPGGGARRPAAPATPPARPPRTPSGGGGGQKKPGSAALLWDQSPASRADSLYRPAAFVQPSIGLAPLSPFVDALLSDELSDDDQQQPPDQSPPAEQQPPQPPRVRRPTSQPAAERRPAAAEPQREARTVPGKEVKALEGEFGASQPTGAEGPPGEGMSGVSGALRGEVTANAVDSQRIVITGDKEDVDFIERILGMMEQTAKESLVDVFTLKSAKATALAPILEKAIKAQIDARTSKPGPQDKFSINAEARSNSLIVSAAAPIMERIKALVDKLDITREGMGTDIRMVALEHIRAAEAVALVKPTVEKLNKLRGEPAESQASIDADERSNSVLIIGTPKDLDEIQKLLNTIDVELTAAQKQGSYVTADAIVIQLKNGSADDIAKVLNDMIKAEQEAATQGGGQQKAVGKPFVKKIRLRLASGEEMPELNLERPIKLVPEKGTNSLIIFSSKENNEALTAIVELFDTLPVGADTDVKAFALQHASAEVIAKLIEDTFKDKSYLARPSEGDSKGLQKGVMPPVPPGLAGKGLPYPLVVQHDVRSNTVLVVGRKDAVLLAGGLISELDRPSADLALKPFVVQLKNAQAAQIQDKFKKLLDDRAKALGADKNAARDNAIVYADERSNKLIVLATEDVYDLVEDLVLQLDAADKYSVVDVRYRALEHADAVKLKNLLEETFKSRADAEKKANKEAADTLAVLADTRSNFLLLTGTRDYLDEADKLITELDRQYEGTVIFRARKLRLNSAANVASLLKEMVDKALTQKDTKLSGTPIQVMADPVSDSLLLAASREDMEVLERWVEILDRPSEVGRMTRIVPLQHAVAEDVAKAVTDIFKQKGGAQKGGEVDVSVTSDKTTNSIVAFGPATLLADVEGFVKELDATEPKKGAAVRIFPLTQAAAGDAGDLLNRILDLRGGSVGGTGGGGGAGGGTTKQESAKQVMIIFQREHPELGLETLKAMRTDIVVISDVRTNSLVVTAPPESMPLMESLVAAVDVPPQNAKIRVFRLRNADAEETVKMLEALFQQKTTTTTGRTGGGQQPERELTVGEGLGGAGGGQQMIAFTTDVRTNSVIAAGTPGYLDLAESMILDLDTIPIQPRDTFVYSPLNTKADSLEPSIKSFSDAEQKRLQDIGKEVSTGVKQERQVTVIANKDANRLIVDVDPRFKETILNVMRELDQPPPQVLIQVLIVEVTMDNSLELGVEFAFQDLDFAEAGPNSTTQFDTVVGTDIGAAGSGLGGFTFTITGADFNFLFRTLQNEGSLNVLSRPQIVAMDNQKASIDVSSDVPYVTGTSTTTGGQITTSVGRSKVGIQLEVTPQINPDGFVRMEIKQTVSDITGSTVDVGPGVTAPIFFDRTANTTVTVKDNETVVLGGLITGRVENREQKIPLVGDIPGLGLLFRHQTDTSKRTELLLVLTPHVIRTPDEFRALSVKERDQLEITPSDILSSPLIGGLQMTPEELERREAQPGQPALAPGETPPPAGQEALPNEEYGPPRPMLRPERPPAPPDTYDVPVSLKTG